MKRLVQAILVVSFCSIFASGCSTNSGPEKPVAGMIENLYFKVGTYEDYKTAFQTPSKVISEQEFRAMQEKETASVFGDKNEADVLPMLRSFQKDENTAVVYLVDFTKDKSNDMHWNVVKTDAGWKIQN